MNEKEVIEKIRECTTREKLFAVLEEASNNDMKFWGENNYKAARELIKHAEGNPETHYGPQHGQLSEEEMFECDVEMFLTRNWEYGMNLKTLKEENDRIRRTMLTYSECITEHQNKIEKLEKENKALKQDWQIMKSTITELNEKIETTKKCLLENKHLLSDTVWVDDFTTLFDYLEIDDE